MKYLRFTAIALAAILAGGAQTAAAQNDGSRQEIKLCNKMNETVYVAIGKGVVAPNMPAFKNIKDVPQWAVNVGGWFILPPRQCKTPKFPIYADSKKITKSAFYVYGETEGLFGGAFKKVWEGSDFKGCMKRKRVSGWGTTSHVLKGDRMIANPCRGSDQFPAGMKRFSHQNSKGQYYYSFGG